MSPKVVFWIVSAASVLGALCRIYLIGAPRKPYTRGDAIGGLFGTAGTIYVYYYLWVN